MLQKALGRRHWLAMWFMCLCAIGGTALAQPRFFQGRVLDPARGPLEDAKVTVGADGQPDVFTGTSDARGEFIASLAPGAYTVKIEATGFNAASVPITVSADETDVKEFVLEITPGKYSITIEDSPYVTPVISSATKTPTALQDIPQSITVVQRQLIKDQLMTSIGDVVKYTPGIQQHQGENNRDQVIIRGNSTSADFYLNGVRDDVQYYRDLYNLDRVEAIKGPNSMIFGRGGGGGVINRVTKEAAVVPLREFSIQGGSFGNKRLAGDINQPLGSKFAVRMNGMFENSNSFRNNVGLQRHAVTPTITYLPGKSTKIVISYENLRDFRTADRGITSYLGAPANVPINTFYGDPNNSNLYAKVNVGTVAVEHQTGRLAITNRTNFAGYDRFYQNYVPGAPNSTATLVPITAYNNATNRLNIINQTNFVYSFFTGKIRHTLPGGIELGGQFTDNFRNTGFFNNTVTAINVPFQNPITTTPVTWRQSATDANNHLLTKLGAAYVQDQIEFSKYLQVVVGARFDQFDLNYTDNRSPLRLRRIDNLGSPRIGVVFKPLSLLSIYYSYTISYLPSSGDQFSSLTNITARVKPEKFTNNEWGAKLDLSRRFALTGAIYRLDRTNTRSTDPNNPTAIIQIGSTRTNGVELGVNGNIMRKWQVAGGYAYQDAFISSATTSALKGYQVGQVPHHTFSLWNNYSVTKRFGAGFGIINRSDSFVAVDNTVVLPGYTRLDLAGFYTITESIRLQVNVENLADLKYYANADSNTNISPGYPRSMRAGLTWRF